MKVWMNQSCQNSMFVKMTGIMGKAIKEEKRKRESTSLNFFSLLAEKICFFYFIYSVVHFFFRVILFPLNKVALSCEDSSSKRRERGAFSVDEISAEKCPRSIVLELLWPLKY